MENKLLSAKQLADALGISKQTVSNWIKAGCPYIIKHPYKFDYNAVIKWSQRRGK